MCCIMAPLLEPTQLGGDMFLEPLQPYKNVPILHGKKKKLSVLLDDSFNIKC